MIQDLKYLEHTKQAIRLQRNILSKAHTSYKLERMTMVNLAHLFFNTADNIITDKVI